MDAMGRIGWIPWLGLGASGCFIGYPPSYDAPWFDSGEPVDAPGCSAVSIEPDDGRDETEFSSVGLVLDAPRTFCGRIDRASNNGQTYTGDVDYGLIQLFDPGRLHLELRWSGNTDLDLGLFDPGSQTWLVDDGGGVLIQKLGADSTSILVAGLDGPPTDYTLTLWVE